MALNHIQITNAKPRGKAYKVADSDGLYLGVQTNVAKLWRMNYRHLGRQKTLYFGTWQRRGQSADAIVDVWRFVVTSNAHPSHPLPRGTVI